MGRLESASFFWPFGLPASIIDPFPCSLNPFHVHANPQQLQVMADIATDEFLASLKVQYPVADGLISTDAGAPFSYISSRDPHISYASKVLKNPWWIVVAVALSTGNRPDAVPVLFKFVLAELESIQVVESITGEKAHEQKLLLARKFRDSLFKSGMVAGYSKVRRL